MATVTRYTAVKSSMTPAALVTLGLLLLIPVLVTVGPIVAAALIARNAGVGWPGTGVFAVLAAVVSLSVLASVVAFGLAWRRGHGHSFDSVTR